jgi:hypothetical protein
VLQSIAADLVQLTQHPADGVVVLQLGPVQTAKAEAETALMAAQAGLRDFPDAGADVLAILTLILIAQCLATPSWSSHLFVRRPVTEACNQSPARYGYTERLTQLRAPLPGAALPGPPR